MSYRPLLIRTGGQNGADRAALEAARICGIETGGVAPLGYRVQNADGSDGSDPSLAGFGLVEHESRDYPPRTRQNVAEADATLWFGDPKSKGGCLTLGICEELSKPYCVNPNPRLLIDWCEFHKIECLNVAGNRASDQNPDIFKRTLSTICCAFAQEEPSIGRVYHHYKRTDSFVVENLAIWKASGKPCVVFRNLSSNIAFARPTAEFVEMLDVGKEQYRRRFYPQDIKIVLEKFCNS